MYQIGKRLPSWILGGAGDKLLGFEIDDYDILGTCNLDCKV